MLKKQKTEQAVKGNGRLLVSRKDRFFDFNMIDRAKSNFRQ